MVKSCIDQLSTTDEGEKLLKKRFAEFPPVMRETGADWLDYAGLVVRCNYTREAVAPWAGEQEKWFVVTGEY